MIRAPLKVPMWNLQGFSDNSLEVFYCKPHGRCVKRGVEQRQRAFFSVGSSKVSKKNEACDEKENLDDRYGDHCFRGTVEAGASCEP
jgi:hypothetical protein